MSLKTTTIIAQQRWEENHVPLGVAICLDRKIHGSLCAKENKMRGRVSVLKYTKNKREGNTSLSYLMKIQIP
jgi:hypothetical protein